RVQVCSDANTVLAEQALAFPGDAVVRELSMESTVGDWFRHPVVGPACMGGRAEAMPPGQARQAEANPDGLRMVESMPMQQFLAFTNGAIPAESLEQLMELSETPAPAASVARTEEALTGGGATRANKKKRGNHDVRSLH